MKGCSQTGIWALAALAILQLIPCKQIKAQSQAPVSPTETIGRAAGRESNPAVDPDKPYTLEELIDLAERNHPRTRIAWEQARQAAAELGVARSEYLPHLTALAVLADEKIINPFPKPLAANGYTMVEIPSAEAGLAVRYTILDMGRRQAGLERAKAEQLAAGAHLQREHQKVAFAVIESFHALIDAEQTLAARQTILATARAVAEAAEAQLASGRATLPDVLDARAGTARAEYELEAALGQERAARVRLRERLGVEPSDQIGIDAGNGQWSREESVEAIADLVETARQQRPDLAALAARLRASQEALRGAEAAGRPVVEFTARGSSQSLWPTVTKDHGSSLGDTTQFVWSAGLTVHWDLFTGGREHSEVARKAAEERQAAAEFEEQSHAVTRATWTAFVDYQTAVRRQQASVALLTAAEAAYESSLDAYHYGVKNLIDLLHAESQLAEARLAVVQAQSAVNNTQANLGYTTGTLLRNAAAQRKP